MKPLIAIPTGDRTEKALETVQKWHHTGLVDIVAYAWDQATADALYPLCKKLFTGYRKPFSALQNFMAANTRWKAFICGADDLWPSEGTEIIRYAAKEVDGKILWVRDGLFDQQPTHPIITRGWYKKHGQIFDEAFLHNFCDTDLFIRASREVEVVKCWQIGFDHRHWIKTKEKQDSIYHAGSRHWDHDKLEFKVKHKKYLDNQGADIPPILTLEIDEKTKVAC
jgi:hypothetical protein